MQKKALNFFLHLIYYGTKKEVDVTDFSYIHSIWLRGEESNLHLWGENPASYLYSHPAM